MVSAWACENNLVLGQIKTAEKSNEITAIPQLLDLLDIAGHTITIDAMGCQKEIAEKIIKNNANYILAVKANQAQLLEDVIDEFKFAKQPDVNVHQDLGHGRIETRTCSIITDFKFIKNKNGWKNLARVFHIRIFSPFVDLTLLAFCISDFSISQLNNASIGCLILDTALEYKSFAALSNFFKTSGIPFTAFTGVNISELKLLFISLKKVRFSFSDQASLNSAKSFTEAAVNIICS
jgi:predicted transposase YbfD/YdcC